MSKEQDPQADESAASQRRPLSDAAKRALAEAAARKVNPPASRGKELNGRQGLDPVRYGDWEVKGLASDF